MSRKLEDRLGLLRYEFDEEPHIILSESICETCRTRDCVAGCPAGCFSVEEDKLVFQYEDCIECGTCKIVCPNGSVEWNYPRGGYGVIFRYG